MESFIITIQIQMNNTESRDMKKIMITERKVLDFSFMLKTPKVQIMPGVIKRLDVEGKGQVISDIKVPCKVYVSYHKYDYEGKFINQVQNLCVRDLQQKATGQIPPGVIMAICSMKLDQKSWFNLKYYQLHLTEKIPHAGCHFYITIDDIKYKNSQTLESKKLVSEECRKQGKALYEKGDYEEALRRYRKQVNISEGLEKKKYTTAELEQIEKINQKAKTNFLRCFNKLTNFDDMTAELAETYSKQFLKQRRDDLTIFLRANVLIQRKYLTNALQLAKQLTSRGNQQGPVLTARIEEKIKEKK